MRVGRSQNTLGLKLETLEKVRNDIMSNICLSRNGNQLATSNDQCVGQLLDRKLMYLLSADVADEKMPEKCDKYCTAYIVDQIAKFLVPIFS